MLRDCCERSLEDVLMERSHPRGWLSLVRRLGVAITVVASVACANGPAQLEGPATLNLAVTPTSVTVVQGGSVEVTGTAVVGGSFAGSTAVTVLDMPAGVSGLVGTPSTSGPTTTVPVTLTAASGAAPGTYTITVRASVSDVTDEATLTLTVVAAPRYTLEVVPTLLTVEQGTSGTAGISLARTNFTQEVSLAAISDARRRTGRILPRSRPGRSRRRGDVRPATAWLACRPPRS